MNEELRIERHGRVTTLVIDRPPLNILDLSTLERLGSMIQALERDDGRLLVLRSATDRAFSAGVAVEDHTDDRIERMLSLFHGALERLRTLPYPTLAAVRGHCLGGGLELAAACDFMLAAEDAHLGQPEVQLGCFPPYAAALYPSRIGYARTLELLLTGRTIGADEAQRIGLVTWTVATDAFEDKLSELTQALSANSGSVCRLIKRAVAQADRLPWATALAESERIYLEDLTATEDMREGLSAFLQKRAPRWRDQ